MTANIRVNAEIQTQRAKLANSYNALLEEFASKDLRSIGNYTLGNLVGKGSFGKVYLATHKLTNGSKVVLKQANKADSNLAREIHHHRQFLHPHIARLYEVIITENSVWLVLEYCPGDELYNYLTHNGPIEPAKVQKIFAQLVGAVSYVHNKSCVHRDLKLENIMLDKKENVKLCDFGFTREYEGKSSYLQTWCGTVCYSAPEMLRGEKYAGEKVDVWSLGIILYALLCGELPFDEDDETETKMKILKEEPKYSDQIPAPARALIISLLSKRPLLRPSLADVLMNPWLADHAPQQQAILKLQQPAAFTTQLEKDTLHRMRSAGVDIDALIEHVLAQRCDSLAGWWGLLIEREYRKEQRMLRRRRMSEAEAKALRRLSGASGHRLDSIGPPIKESEEEGSSGLSAPRSSSRGRRATTGSGTTSNLPTLQETPANKTPPKDKTLPLPVRESPVARSTSETRRPPLPPKDDEKRMMHAATSPDLLDSGSGAKKRRGYQRPFISQLVNFKHWFNPKRGKSPGAADGAADGVAFGPVAQTQRNSGVLRRVSTDTHYKRRSGANFRPDLYSNSTFPKPRPQLTISASATSTKRLSSQSHSPSQLTPRSSYRGSSNLRGRESTSSSVSSVRSMHQPRPSHSKASSTSSASVASPSTSTRGGLAVRSPSATSVKVMALPSPSSGTFSSGIRGVRVPSLNLQESHAAFSGLGPPSPGVIFAKKRRSPLKGPSLGNGARRRNDGTGRGASRHGSTSEDQGGARSGLQIIADEDEEVDEEIEEVDTFSPDLGPGEFVVMDELPMPDFHTRL